MADAKVAVETGVDGLDLVIGTSSFLREHSHGKDMAYITKTALEVIDFVKSKGLEVRCESKFSLHPRSTVNCPVHQHYRVSSLLASGVEVRSCLSLPAQ